MAFDLRFNFQNLKMLKIYEELSRNFEYQIYRFCGSFWYKKRANVSGVKLIERLSFKNGN